MPFYLYIFQSIFISFVFVMHDHPFFQVQFLTKRNKKKNISTWILIPCFLSSFARNNNCLNCILAAEINFYWVINKPRTKHNGYEAGRIPFISQCCCIYSHLQYIINKNVCSYNIRTMSRLLHNVTEYEHELSMAFIAATYI